MSAARTAPSIMPPRIRIPSFAVWEVVVFVLNVLAFILIGLQLGPILSRLTREETIDYAWIAAAVTVATIAARMIWVLASSAFFEHRHRQRSNGSDVADPATLSWAETVVVAWCGMRGTVTIAAAIALPAMANGEFFPHRVLILVTSFRAVLATLVIQGLTLRPLMQYLGLKEDGEVDCEVRLVRVETLRAALNASKGPVEHEIATVLRRRLELQLGRAEAELASGCENDESQLDREADETGLAVIPAAGGARRQKLLALRENGTIGDVAFQKIEQELDWAELSFGHLLEPDSAAS